MRLARMAAAVPIFFILSSLPADSAVAQQTWASCRPADVTAFPERVHVRCDPMVGEGIFFFAVPTSDASMTNMVLSLASTAIAYGKELDVLYDPDDTTTGPQYGCAAHDCRPIRAIALRR